VDLAKLLAAESAMRGRERLAVYAFDSPAPYRVISMIFAEALRQEIFKLGIFDLVNREDMAWVSEEIWRQQTGFVDEKFRLVHRFTECYYLPPDKSAEPGPKQPSIRGGKREGIRVWPYLANLRFHQMWLDQ
jgi:hypothetical protein